MRTRALVIHRTTGMYKGSSSLRTAVHGLIFQYEMQNRAILSSIKQRILLSGATARLQAQYYILVLLRFALRLLFKRFIVTLISFPWFSQSFRLISPVCRQPFFLPAHHTILFLLSFWILELPETSTYIAMGPFKYYLIKILNFLTPPSLSLIKDY